MGKGWGFDQKSKNPSQIPKGGDMNVIEMYLIRPTQGQKKVDNKESHARQTGLFLLSNPSLHSPPPPP